MENEHTLISEHFCIYFYNMKLQFFLLLFLLFRCKPFRN